MTEAKHMVKAKYEYKPTGPYWSPAFKPGDIVEADTPEQEAQLDASPVFQRVEGAKKSSAKESPKKESDA